MTKKKTAIQVSLGDIKKFGFSQNDKIDEEDIKWFMIGFLMPEELTEKQLEVFHLKTQTKKTEEEIAEILGISRRAVRDRWELIGRKGRKIFSRYEFVYSDDFVSKEDRARMREEELREDEGLKKCPDCGNWVEK